MFRAWTGIRPELSELLAPAEFDEAVRLAEGLALLKT